jgi:tetratricopeptide (TPR) repeat protein
LSFLTSPPRRTASALGLARRWIEARLGRRVLVWALLLAVSSAGLCLVPLFNVLGYDYALVIGLLAALAAVDIGHGAAAAARRSGGRQDPGLVVTAGTLGALATLAVPLGLALLNAFRVRNCNLAAGFQFFALLPVATTLYAAPLGALAGLAFPRRGRLVAYIIPLLSVSWSLWRLYSDPPVFVFDPFGGYFPGPIYDEALRPPERLVHFRLVNLIWVSTALACAATIVRRRRSRRSLLLAGAASLLLLSVSTALFLQRDRLGFHVDKHRLTEVLGRETRSAHFVVHSDPAADGTPEERELVLRDLEFRFDQLVRILGATPRLPITVYLFPSAAAKKDLVGAGGTLYAKPWKQEIFLQSERFPARRLRHEMAHVFASAFGDPVFGVSLAWRLPLPRLASGLIEGIAEAADHGDPWGRSTVHQEARGMIAANLAPPLAKVVGAGFSTLSGPRAYTIAGSFTHFLLASAGAERMRALYRSGGDFVRVYGRPLEALEPEWRAFVLKQPLDQREQARARERFRRPAIFGKVCARELAARVAEARGRLYSVPDKAVAILRSVCQDDPHEPSYRLDLAEALGAAGATDAASRESGAVENDEAATHPLRARAALIAGNALYHAGRFQEARAAIERSLRFATDDGEHRTGLVKLRALDDDLARGTIGRVLFGDSPLRGVEPGLAVFLIDRFAQAVPDEALGPYLLGRQIAYRDPRLSLDLLEKACPLAGGTPLPRPLLPIFVKECHALVSESAFRAGDLERSQLALDRAVAGAETAADRLRALDFMERVEWEKRRVAGYRSRSHP